MNFKVFGYDAEGLDIVKSISAESEGDARKLSGIPDSRIVSVKKDAFSSFFLSLSNPKPKGEVQAVFMASLGALLLSGSGVQKGIDRLLTAYRDRIKFDQEKVRSQSKASDILRALNFDPVSVTLVQVGEKTGKVPQALSKAATNIIYQMRLREDLGKDLMMALVYLVIGAGLLMITIFGFAPVLNDIDGESSLRLPMGFATSFILNSYAFIMQNWVILLLIIAGFVAKKGWIWLQIRHLPVLSWIWSIKRLQNAIFFTSGFRTLFEAGIPDDKAFMLLRDGAPASSQALYSDAIRLLNEGSKMSFVIDNDEWPEALRDGLSGFEGAPYATKIQIIDNLSEILLLQQRIVGKRVAKLAFLMGMIIAVSAVLLMIFGAVFPLQQVTAI